MVELLVVALIIGILAAIALPAFTGQTRKGQDASAKHNARALVGAVEACRTNRDDYTLCDSETKLTADQGTPLSLSFGSGAGQVEVQNSATKSYDAVAHSTSGKRLHHHPQRKRGAELLLHDAEQRQLPGRRDLVGPLGASPEHRYAALDCPRSRRSSSVG